MKSTFIILLLIASLPAIGQKKAVYSGFPSLVWPVLYDIKYESVKDELGDFEKPVFPAAVRKLEGKTVTLPGYLVPFESGVTARRFMLSSLPLNACFFCGVGGPETVIEVVSAKDVTYTEKPVQISGILRLNDADPDKMIYTLDEATYLGEIDF